MLTEGLVRKLFPDLAGRALLIKDSVFALQVFLLVFELLLCLSLRQRLGRWAAFPGLRFAAAGLVIVAILSSFSLWYGRVNVETYLLGFREYFFYVPLVMIAFDYFQDIQRRDRFLYTLVLTAVLMDIAGLAQVMGIIDSSLLRPIEAHVPSHSSEFGEYIYASSVFDVPERFAVFNLFILFVSASLLTRQSRKSRRALLALVIALSWLSLFVSARRIAFILGSLVLPILIVGQNRRKVLAVLLMAVLMWVSLSILELLQPTLSQVITANTMDDILFYLDWSIRDLQRSMDFAPSLFYGNLGLTSPGIGFTGIGRSPIYGILEGLWAKTVYSLGPGGAFILLVAQVVVILEIFRIYRRTREQLIGAVLLYLVCMSTWNIKSGDYLVWTPFTMIIVGLAYATRVVAYRGYQPVTG